MPVLFEDGEEAGMKDIVNQRIDCFEWIEPTKGEDDESRM